MVVWICACPIRCMSAGKLMPARIMSVAKVCRNRWGLAFGDTGGLAMMTEQGTETRGSHACSACASFQANEQGRAAVRGTFQTQVMVEQLDRFRSEWQKAHLVPFAAYADLRLRQDEIFLVESQHFT